MNMHIHILCQNILSLLMVYGTTRLMKYFTRINVFIVNKYIVKNKIVKVDVSTQTDDVEPVLEPLLEPLSEPLSEPLLEPVSEPVIGAQSVTHLIEPLKNDYDDWVDMASAIAYSAD